MQLTIRTYKELAQWSKAFVEDDSIGLFFLIGNPGYGKSFTLRKLLNEKSEKAKIAATKKKGNKPDNGLMPVTGEQRPLDHKQYPLWLEGGSISAFKLYQMVYQHLDQSIILDDCDQTYQDKSLVRLLKSICQTEKVKEISWTTSNKQLINEGIPSSYKCRSRVGIIANKWETLNQHVGSLASRGVMLEFEPSIPEVFKYVKNNNIIADVDIIKYVEKYLWMAQKIDIRDFINASAIKRSKLPWQDAMANSLGIREMLFLQEMENDKTFKPVSEEEKATRFKQLSGLSRPMFFKYRTMLDQVKAERAAS